VPFVRFSRDRRGYEHTYLIHAAPRRGAPTRILYWYRTPPGIRVGREAFDVEARRMLESQYPSVAFDWPKLLETPMPPPEAENWRERRRVERSARQARQTEELEELPADAIEPAETPPAAPSQAAVVGAGSVEEEPASADPPDSANAANPARKRRRRGGRRRRKQGSAAEAGNADDEAPDRDPDSRAMPPTLREERALPAAPLPEPPSAQDTKASG
jgi:ribonuclease E